MKRIALFVLIALVAVSGVSFAAGQKMGFGGYMGAIGTGPLNGLTNAAMPTFSIQATKDLNLEFGLSFGSMNNDVAKGSDSQFNLLAKGDMALAGISHIGASLLFSSDSNYAVIKDGDAGSGFTFGIYYGVRAEVVKTFALCLDLYPVTFTSLSIGGKSVSSFGLGKVAFGGVMYL